MDLRLKRKIELDSQKEKRRAEIVQVAIEVFKEKGIDNAKMTDIAEKAQFGIATVYRYFNTKTELVIASATWLWNEEMSVLNNMFNEADFLELRAVERVRKILELSLDIYHNHQDLLRFLEQFDNYIVKEQIPLEKLENYEKNIIDMKYAMFSAINQGKKEGSIKDTVDLDTFYMTIMHSLMSLCQKLILRGRILNSDNEIQGDDQIRLLIDMALNYISK